MGGIDVRAAFDHWVEHAKDEDVAADLARLSEAGDAAVADAFFQNLEFGTAGLRGIIGAGTNRMNVYTVARATQGLADHLNDRFDAPSVAISCAPPHACLPRTASAATSIPGSSRRPRFRSPCAIWDAAPALI